MGMLKISKNNKFLKPRSRKIKIFSLSGRPRIIATNISRSDPGDDPGVWSMSSTVFQVDPLKDSGKSGKESCPNKLPEQGSWQKSTKEIYFNMGAHQLRLLRLYKLYPIILGLKRHPKGICFMGIRAPSNWRLWLVRYHLVGNSILHWIRSLGIISLS